jgi:hypothetical protein
MLKNSASDLDRKDSKNHDSWSTAEDDHTEVAGAQIGVVRLGLRISRLAQQTPPPAPNHRWHGLLWQCPNQGDEQGTCRTGQVADGQDAGTFRRWRRSLAVESPEVDGALRGGISCGRAVASRWYMALVVGIQQCGGDWVWVGGNRM